MAAAILREVGSVRDYHQGLAQHLLDLIRKTKSASTTPLDTKQSPPPSTSSPPTNPRQLSDSSLESESKISSGQTTESKPSSGAQQTVDSKSSKAEVAEITNSASSTDDSGVDGDGERSDRDAEGEGSQSGSASGSHRHDQTARPELNHSQLLPVPISHPITTPTAASSTTGPERSAKSQDQNNQSSQSSSNLYARPSPNPHGDAGPTPQAHPHTHPEHLTREDEHRKAWETDGKRVWRSIAPHFELRLEKKPRAESNASSAVSPARSIISGPSGAGPGTAIRADADHPVFIPDSGVTTDRETTSEVSQSQLEDTLPQSQSQSQSSLSMSIAKPIIKRRSTLQKRQDRLWAESESEPEAHGRAPLDTIVDSTPTKATVGGPSSHQEVKNKQLSPSDEEQNEYQSRREARTKRKQESLAKRVGFWRTQVIESGLHNTLFFTPPEIEPHLPSPTIESSRLRFEPIGLAPDMLHLMDAQSPNLSLPPLRLIEDNRKLRSLRLIPEPTTSESDVDLLIRLTKLNRISSATSNSFRGAGAGAGSGAGAGGFPLGGSPYGTHRPLDVRPTSSTALVTGAVETHSLRIKGTMPTPRARSQADVGSVTTLTPI